MKIFEAFRKSKAKIKEMNIVFVVERKYTDFEIIK